MYFVVMQMYIDFFDSGELYAANGPNSKNSAIQGFTINPDNGKILNSWSPKPLVYKPLLYIPYNSIFSTIQYCFKLFN